MLIGSLLLISALGLLWSSGRMAMGRCESVAGLYGRLEDVGLMLAFLVCYTLSCRVCAANFFLCVAFLS